MNLDNLLKEFKSLPVPEVGRMATIIIGQPDVPRVYLGKTHDSRAAFLVERPSKLSLAGGDIGQVRVSPYEWSDPVDNIERQALVITLLARDPAILRGFLIAGIGFIPEIRKVDDRTALRYLEELAAALHTPTSREMTVRVLWAELFFMRTFASYDAALGAWQRNLSDRFDFAIGINRFEVKSYSTAERLLKFRHQQTHAPEGQELDIVSIRLQESAAGESLERLANYVIKNLSGPADRVRVLRAVDQAQGEQGIEREVLFDVGIAEETIGLTRGDMLPRLPLDLPEGVRDAHIDVSIPDIEPERLGVVAVKTYVASKTGNA